jgi:hypothetical protein
MRGNQENAILFRVAAGAKTADKTNGPISLQWFCAGFSAIFEM